MTDTNIITDPITPQDPAPRRPLRKLAIAGIAVFVLAAVAAGLLIAGVFSGPSGPSGQLAADGYTLTRALTHGQLSQLAGSDSQLVMSYVEGGAVGTRPDGSTEAVVQLTPAGVQLFGPLLPMLSGSLSQGETVRMTGSYLIVDEPAGSSLSF